MRPPQPPRLVLRVVTAASAGALLGAVACSSSSGDATDGGADESVLMGAMDGSVVGAVRMPEGGDQDVFAGIAVMPEGGDQDVFAGIAVMPEGGDQDVFAGIAVMPEGGDQDVAVGVLEAGGTD
jgi:hypothetical protein